MNLKLEYKTGDDLVYMVVESSLSIKEGIYFLNKNRKNIIFLVDSSQRLVGTLTDGDVRRAFSRGVSHKTKLEKVMNANPVFCKRETGTDEVLPKLGEEYKRGQVPYIPVVNSEKRIVGYYSFYDVAFIPMAQPSFRVKEISYVLDCVRTGWVSSQGKYIKKFEDAFGEFSESKYALATCNGTAALHLALESLGVGKGDEVIIPSLTFIATANAVTYTGATPVFADSEESTWNLNPSALEKLITNKTKAIIPVHLYGQPCKMDEILGIAKRNGIHVVEDAAESTGSYYKNKPTGSLGDIGCFSFFGNKIITTGEGGMLVTDSKEIYEKARMLRDHGMDPNKKYWHPCIGYNYRMTNMQAAVGLAQIERIEGILSHKKKISEVYRTELHNVEGLTLPPENDWSTNVCWMFSILLKDNINRDEFILQLAKRNIECRPLFYPIHKMPPYETNVSLSVCESLSSKGITLPSYADIGPEQISRICKEIKNLLVENDSKNE